MSPPPLPVIRLKPKADTRTLRFGHPWVYGNELVLDRRAKKIAPGSIVRLESADKASLAVAGFNAGSKIAARVLTLDPEQDIDDRWIAERLAKAAALRERLYDAPFYRLAHAEADGLPGVVIDRFGDTAVLQANAAWADARADAFVTGLKALGMDTVILNGTGRARSLEGLPEMREVIAGQGPESPVSVPMNRAIYLADLMGGQKTGLYYDQRPNHAFLQGCVRPEDRVLDVFTHVGGFGLAALAAGARAVTAVDGSAAALDLAGEGAARTGLGDRFVPRKGDAFEALADFQASDARFEAVICDPPAFAPSKSALEAGLRAYERLARLSAPLVTGGILVLCWCSHAAHLDKFRAASLRGVGRAGRRAQILHTGFAGPDHPQHPALAESGDLKALFLRLL